MLERLFAAAGAAGCVAGCAAISAMSIAPPAWAQSVISAHSGVIHYVEGDVTIDGTAVHPKFAEFPDVKSGQLVATEEGRAESPAHSRCVSAHGGKQLGPHDFECAGRYAAGSGVRLGTGRSRRTAGAQRHLLRRRGQTHGHSRRKVFTALTRARLACGSTKDRRGFLRVRKVLPRGRAIRSISTPPSCWTPSLTPKRPTRSIAGARAVRNTLPPRT